MSVIDNTHTSPALSGDDIQYLDALFSHLKPQHIEGFYKYYQRWQLMQQLTELQAQLITIEQNSVDNATLMQITQPSPIALAALTRLQSHGVDDVDLLDSMLERGDTWLDHTLQLLEQCQSLGFIRDNYTEWCQHALEGAYEWLDSMSENEVAQAVQPMQEQVTQDPISGDATEVLLVQKLMSEEEILKIPSILSYPIELTIAPEESVQHEEVIPTPTHPIHEIPPEDKQQKSPKPGLMSRILSKVWHT